MIDMLLYLLKLPAVGPLVERLRREGIIIRRARTFERTIVGRFVETFATAWADEVSAAYANKPVSLFIATHEGCVIGFAAYECTARAFLGPMGVAENYRGKDIGAALALSAAHGLAELGYVYGIVGGVGPAEFYARTLGAIPIPDSTPGLYTDLLQKDSNPREGS